MSEKDPVSKTFRYEGYDIITLEKMVDREYQLTEPQTARPIAVTNYTELAYDLGKAVGERFEQWRFSYPFLDRIVLVRHGLRRDRLVRGA